MNTWFKATLIRGGEPRHVIWREGKLLGDPDIVFWVEFDARNAEGRSLGLMPFSSSTHNHLKHPYTVISLLEMLHDRGTQVNITDGDVEPIGPPPEGAVY